MILFQGLWRVVFLVYSLMSFCFQLRFNLPCETRLWAKSESEIEGTQIDRNRKKTGGLLCAGVIVAVNSQNIKLHRLFHVSVNNFQYVSF